MITKTGGSGGQDMYSCVTEISSEDSIGAMYRNAELLRNELGVPVAPLEKTRLSADQVGSFSVCRF